jgi:hypothetical protein
MFIKMWGRNISLFHSKMQNEMCLTGKNINIISFEVNIIHLFIHAIFKSAFSGLDCMTLKIIRFWYDELEKKRKQYYIIVGTILAFV